MSIDQSMSRSINSYFPWNNKEYLTVLASLALLEIDEKISLGKCRGIKEFRDFLIYHYVNAPNTYHGIVRELFDKKPNTIEIYKVRLYEMIESLSSLRIHTLSQLAVREESRIFFMKAILVFNDYKSYDSP